VKDLSLYTKITSLPDSLKSEVVDFIDFISKRKRERIKKTRIFGYAKDTIIIKPDFDDPIDEFKEYM
jgi:hypothetical protein